MKQFCQQSAKAVKASCYKKQQCKCPYISLESETNIWNQRSVHWKSGIKNMGTRVSHPYISHQSRLCLNYTIVPKSRLCHKQYTFHQRQMHQVMPRAGPRVFLSCFTQVAIKRKIHWATSWAILIYGGLYDAIDSKGMKPQLVSYGGNKLCFSVLALLSQLWRTMA